jgi:hypothetical protein
MAELLHPSYLPCSEKLLRQHFAPVDGRGGAEEADRHLTHYRRSLDRLAQYERAAPADCSRLVRRGRQLEKDERFWIVAALMRAYHSNHRIPHRGS